MNILLRVVELSAFVGRSLAVGSKIEVLWRYEMQDVSLSSEEDRCHMMMSPGQPRCLFCHSHILLTLSVAYGDVNVPRMQLSLSHISSLQIGFKRGELIPCRRARGLLRR